MHCTIPDTVLLHLKFVQVQADRPLGRNVLVSFMLDLLKWRRRLAKPSLLIVHFGMLLRATLRKLT